MSAVAPDEKAIVPQLGNKESNQSTSSLDEKHSPQLSHTDSTVDVTKSSDGVDVVAKLLSGHAEDAEMSPEAAKKIRNKLDRNMLPLLFILYTRTSSSALLSTSRGCSNPHHFIRSPIP